MRVYFRNGTSVRISQSEANELVEMLISKSTSKSKNNCLVRRSAFSQNIFSFFADIDEILAIR